jgi:transcriptional regulator of arginine metabolism
MNASPARVVNGVAKPARHRAILNVVRGGVIRTQEDLVAELHRRRFAVTQATVSRDIRELGLVRVHDDEGPRYMAPVAEIDADQTMHRLRNAIEEHVVTMEFVDLLGIIHTAPGCAPLVAGALDASRFEEVAGTIAGDDTVLVITRDPSGGDALAAQLLALAERRR